MYIFRFYFFVCFVLTLWNIRIYIRRLISSDRLWENFCWFNVSLKTNRKKKRRIRRKNKENKRGEIIRLTSGAEYNKGFKCSTLLLLLLLYYTLYGTIGLISTSPSSSSYFFGLQLSLVFLFLIVSSPKLCCSYLSRWVGWMRCNGWMDGGKCH
jgi:hypothetical protein